MSQSNSKDLITELKTIIGPHMALDLIMNHKDEQGNPYYNPDAITNEKMKNGTIKYHYEHNGKTINHCCPWHTTDKTNSTTSKVLDEKTPDGKPLDRVYVCRTPSCRVHNLGLDIFRIFGLAVENVPESQLDSTEGKKTYFYKALRFYAKATKLEHLLKKFDETQLSPEERHKYRLKSAVYALQRFYTDCFMGRVKKNKIDEYAKKARDYYLNVRGFKYAFWDYSLPEEQQEEAAIAKALEFAEKKGVGFAPGRSGWTIGYQYLKSLPQNFTDEELYEASLIGYKYVDGKQTNEYCDFYTNRLTLLIEEDLKTGLPGIYGRDLNPDSDFRHKKPRNYNGVYGYRKALKNKVVFVGEGEWDAKTIESFGLPSFPLGGTDAFGDLLIDDMVREHHESNGEYLQEVVLVCDGDQAGQSANFKYGKQLSEKGIYVTVATINHPEDKKFDPNAMLTTYEGNAKEKFLEAINNRVSFESFAIVHILNEHDLSNEHGQRIALKKAYQYMQHLNPTEQLFTARKVQELLKENDAFNNSTDENFFINALVCSWQAMNVSKAHPPTQPATIPTDVGYETAKKYPFMVLTKEQDMYEILQGKYHLPNVVLVRNSDVFLQKYLNEEGLLRKALKEGQTNTDLPKNAILDITFSSKEWNEYENHFKIQQLQANVSVLTSSQEPIHSFYRKSPSFL
ncbi:hypothetical protein bcgnr5372_34070 [Bacillus luti]|nr:hypothetical protein [Bacillus cereus]HDR8329579.1 hypothetical protein [Bacillus cereus]HDR8332908.1 hypothetical protein [Bacillus cereus]